MGNISRGLIAAACLVALTGCGGGATPEGLVAALEDAGVGLDPATSAERYYDAVEAMCDLDGDYSTATLRGFGHEDNAAALERMVVGMDYMCDDGQLLAKRVDQFARAFGED